MVGSHRIDNSKGDVYLPLQSLANCEKSKYVVFSVSEGSANAIYKQRENYHQKRLTTKNRLQERKTGLVLQLLRHYSVKMD